MLPAAVTTTTPASGDALCGQRQRDTPIETRRTACADREVHDPDVVAERWASTQSSAAIALLIVPRPFRVEHFERASVAVGRDTGIGAPSESRPFRR